MYLSCICLLGMNTLICITFSFSWFRGLAAISACGSSWTFLFTFFNVSNNLIIVGDVDEDQLNVNNHHLKKIKLLNNMKNVISEPTRVTATTSTLIDPILVSQHCDPLHSGVLDIPGWISDHKATFIYIPFTSICSLAYKRKSLVL